MKKYLISILILFVVGIPYCVHAHVSNPNLPEGCGSCHVGHGKADEPMLTHSEEEFCYQCHGTELNQSAMKSAGKLSQSVSLLNIEKEFDKPYRHPVVDGFGHSPTERLPLASSATIDHAECVDCHNPHQRIQLGEKSMYEVSGYSLSGQYLDVSINEYEICFKCHIDQNSVGSSSENAYKDFSVSFNSQHPVTKPSGGGKSKSLTKALGPGGKMKCSDCHTNDDPDGPKGPHGSNNRFLLSGNYEIDSEADESPYAYEFCYSCHDRSSILNNESFSLHKEHIVGDPLNNKPGTSCYTCHASHSSKLNNHLIAFNREVVNRSGKLGIIRYNSTGPNNGECFLHCHGHEHGPAKY